MMSAATDPHVLWLLGHFNKVRSKPSKNGMGWMVCCPAHDDNIPSLSIDLGGEGILMKCFAGCPVRAICQAAGFEEKMLFYNQWDRQGGRMEKSEPKERKIDATYLYMDEGGRCLYRAIRYRPKSFAFQQKTDGKWQWGLEGCRLIPYRLQEVEASRGQKRLLYIVEGEKKVDLLLSKGLIATCNPGGTGMGWKLDYSKLLTGFRVVILPDKDEAGMRHAWIVAGMLMGFAKSIQILMLPGLEEKQDVVDWFAQGHHINELWELVTDASYYQMHQLPRRSK